MSYFPPPVAPSVGPFGETIVAEREVLLHFTPHQGNGESVFRFNEVLTGSASWTINNNSEWQFTTTASGTDAIRASAHDNPRFWPGQWGESGWTVRSPDTFTGNQFAEWGMMTRARDTGVGWGVDSNGLYIWTVRNSSKTKVASSSFSHDPLSGSGSSGLTWAGTTATKFTVEFDSSWWTGSMAFYAFLVNSSGELKKVLAHRYSPLTGAIDSPTTGARPYFNLDNNGTATARNIYASEFWTTRSGRGGRVNYRTIGQYRLNLAPTTTEIPFVAFRKKSGDYDVPVFLQGFDIYTSDPCILFVKQNPTLTTPTWSTPDATATTETAVEKDTVSTSYSGGTNRWTGMVGAGTTLYSWEEAKHPRIYLFEQVPTVLLGRSMTGTITTLHVLFRVEEEW